MDRLCEAVKNQTKTYLALKFLCFSICSGIIYFEIYSGIYKDQRPYKTSWNCYSKAAFNYPNPYFGDVQVNEEFSRSIDIVFLLSASGSATSLISLLLSLCTDSFNRIMSIIDCMIGLGCLVWLIFSTVCRFSHTGRVCSGSYQHVGEVMYPYDFQQGQFLFYIVSLGWSVPLFSLVLISIFCPRKSSLYRVSGEFQDLAASEELNKSFGDISHISVRH